MKPFLDGIGERVLVRDGAMGTMLYSKGVFVNQCFHALNCAESGPVAVVHGEYVRAGADAFEPNTFGVNRIKLRGFGLADRLRDINVKGARLARGAANGWTYVAGAIGLLGICVEPWGRTGKARPISSSRRRRCWRVESISSSWKRSSGSSSGLSQPGFRSFSASGRSKAC